MYSRGRNPTGGTARQLHYERLSTHHNATVSPALTTFCVGKSSMLVFLLGPIKTPGWARDELEREQPI